MDSDSYMGLDYNIADEYEMGDDCESMATENYADNLSCQRSLELVTGTNGKKCRKCDSVFPNGRLLANHNHNHNQNAVHTFKSEFCNMTFGTKSSRRVHDRIHTGERPYKCSTCHKAFVDRSTLTKHFRIHTEEKPFVCVVCKRAFNQNVTLRSHIRSLHSAPSPELGTSAKPYSCRICSSLFTTAEDLIADLIAHCGTKRALTRKRPLYTDFLRHPTNPVKQEAIETVIPESDDSEDLEEVTGDNNDSLRKSQLMPELSTECDFLPLGLAAIDQ